MKQNICELDTMIFFREALEAHEFMLLPVMASAVGECRTADKELKTLNEDGEIGLARLDVYKRQRTGRPDTTGMEWQYFQHD